MPWRGCDVVCEKQRSEHGRTAGGTKALQEPAARARQGAGSAAGSGAGSGALPLPAGPPGAGVSGCCLVLSSPSCLSNNADPQPQLLAPCVRGGETPSARGCPGSPGMLGTPWARRAAATALLPDPCLEKCLFLGFAGSAEAVSWGRWKEGSA